MRPRPVAPRESPPFRPVSRHRNKRCRSSSYTQMGGWGILHVPWPATHSRQQLDPEGPRGQQEPSWQGESEDGFGTAAHSPVFPFRAAVWPRGSGSCSSRAGRVACGSTFWVTRAEGFLTQENETVTLKLWRSWHHGSVGTGCWTGTSHHTRNKQEDQSSNHQNLGKNTGRRWERTFCNLGWEMLFFKAETEMHTKETPQCDERHYQSRCRFSNRLEGGYSITNTGLLDIVERIWK